MHRFDRMHLSPTDALRTLEAIDLEEKSRIAEGIALIAVIDHRRDYLAAGYSCMRDYCMGRLHMSEDAAFRRIQVARVALRFPQVFEFLADGRLGVTTAATLVPHLTSETAAELLAAAAFRTKQEVLKLLAERSRPAAVSPEAFARETPVETSSGSLAPAQVNSLSDLCSRPVGGGPAGPHAPAHVDHGRRGRVTSTASGNHEVRLILTDEELEHFRRARALLGHAVPSGDPALIYARAMKHYLAHLEKQRFGTKRGVSKTEPVAPKSNDVETGSGSLAPERVNGPRGRGIPKALRRQIWERDGGSCAFESADGHRCSSTTRVEIDHITPVAHGGRTELENLRLLCRAHNPFEAERVLGADHVRTQRELAQRDRAQAKVAAEAKAARTEAREDEHVKEQDDATQARNDDLNAALRGLGFTATQARRGVEVADTMPEATLETCLRHALKVLTRATVMRGEWRARCTA